MSFTTGSGELARLGWRAEPAPWSHRRAREVMTRVASDDPADVSQVPRGQTRRHRVANASSSLSLLPSPHSTRPASRLAVELEFLLALEFGLILVSPLLAR
jgi:hypothetical protein